MVVKKELKRKPTAKAKIHRKTGAIVAHASEGSHNAVMVDSLHVLIVKDGDCWFARSLEIDYAAQGKSVKDVQQAFADGLSLTIAENLKVYGNLDKLFNDPSPGGVWAEYHDLKDKYSLHNHITIVEVNQQRFPYKHLAFIHKEAPIAANIQ